MRCTEIDCATSLSRSRFAVQTAELEISLLYVNTFFSFLTNYYWAWGLNIFYQNLVSLTSID